MTVVRKNVARAHHFLSQCYLKGFTQQGTKDCKITTLNLEKKSFFITTPKNVGHERDFNTIDLNGFEPDYLESQLSHFESNADKAIRNIETTGSFEGEDRLVVLNLLAYLLV